MQNRTDSRLRKLENLRKPEEIEVLTDEERNVRIMRLLTEQPDSEAAKRVASILERARARREERRQQIAQA